jgi:hypothetical protein
MEFVREGQEEIVSANGPLSKVEGATEQERFRFLVARKGDEDAAASGLDKYLKWKDAVPLPLPSDRMRYEQGQGPGCPDKLPAWISMLMDGEGNYVRCKKTNTRILMAFGAMCDLDHTAEDYVAATADVLFANLAADSSEKITVLVDVRAGEGWKDPPPMKFIPLVREINAQMSRNFPERIASIYVYPMPWWAVAIYNMVSLFLDPKTSEKMNMLSGPALVDSPDPEGLHEIVDEGVATVKNMVPYPEDHRPPTPTGAPCGVATVGGYGSSDEENVEPTEKDEDEDEDEDERGTAEEESIWH